MNTSAQYRRSVPTHPTRYLPRRLLLGVLLVSATFGAGAEDSFQMKVLFEPDTSMLQAEARGHVMIYDGLDEAVVERAFDEQFDRIENMMFTRVRHAEPDGEVITEDDGC